jgi:hypothetical protein
MQTRREYQLTCLQVLGTQSLTSKELSTALPRPLMIPQLPRMIAHANAKPMRIASTWPISGKEKIRNRKYIELEMIPADNPMRPIYSLLAYSFDSVASNTYHPTVTMISVYNPSCQLSACLDNQQATETFSDLKDWSRPSQNFIPTTYCGTLQ